MKYSEWLLEHAPEKPALHRLLQKHSPFFERLDVSFDNTNLLTKQALLETMGTAYLRKFLLASKFVMNQLEGEVSTTEMMVTSESATIQNKLIELAKKPYGLLLRNYVEWLEEHKTAIRTIRLYLRAAEKFCSDQNITSEVAPTQIQVNSFAKAHKGSINSFFRFISFGKSRLMWTMTSPKKLPLKRLPLPVKRISALKEMIKSKGIESVRVEVLTKLMAILLGFKSTEVTLDKIKLDSQGVKIIEIQGELIYPPQSLNVYMNELVKRGELLPL